MQKRGSGSKSETQAEKQGSQIGADEEEKVCAQWEWRKIAPCQRQMLFPAACRVQVSRRRFFFPQILAQTVSSKSVFANQIISSSSAFRIMCQDSATFILTVS